MIRCNAYSITFQEVPDETSLSLSISNCTGRCEGCHSPWLREDIGEDLIGLLPSLLNKYKDLVTCVCFLGEGNDPSALLECIKLVKEDGLKVCLYSGRDLIETIPLIDEMLPILDYLKIGSYQEQLGGLSSPTSNQMMFKFNHDKKTYRIFGPKDFDIKRIDEE